jgi:hypothetical protein
MNEQQIRKLSTQRLLKIYRQVRSNIWGRDLDRNPDWEIYDEEEDRFFDNLKNELDKREHVVRRPRKKAALPAKKRIK